MTIYEPNPDIRPTGEEAGEFIDPPAPDPDETVGPDDDKPGNRLVSLVRLCVGPAPTRSGEAQR